MKGGAKELRDLELVNRLLDSFSRISGVINTPRLDYAARLGRILEVILEYLRVEQGSLMVLERKKYLVVRAASRPEIIGHEQTIEKERSVAAWVARHQEPLFIKDIAKDSRFDTMCRGSYRRNSLLSMPILHKGKVLGVINVTDKIGDRDLLKEDITRLFDFSSVILSLLVQENLQQDLRRQQRILRERNKELRHQETLRAELSSMLVHDLKGPLSEVVANLDILSYTVSEENREFLESAQIGCDRAVRMVSNLVSIGKIEDGKLTPIKEVVAPGPMLAECLSSIKGMARIKDVALILEVQEDLPQIALDRILILRVLQNLLTNALGYCPSNTTIRFGCRRVVGKKQLEFYVQDQGPGIPASKHRAIFEKYARISNKQDALVGTGLGLYFCRLAVEIHRGRIFVESEPGKGSRFNFTLPL
ncbi:GAF domain-containing sensor histidine kinase [Thiovibrio frasassiensis]|uniref:histidine kinase n=1 Tax=Thiovibrio frasassiensis TaxID=2984131 RepID=A0A9X4MFX1_9BACT|nr:ATP-binding protein [Thiovibrio frasassiensis]MDG4475586.1 ATP-binding protein [Thiovibrio frasassiensis]